MDQKNLSDHQELDKNEAAKIPLEQIHPSSVTDFRIFLHDDRGHYSLYTPAGHRWTAAELQTLTKDGHAILFYHTSDAPIVETYLKVSALPQINTALPPEARLVNITDVGAELTRLLYEQPMTASALEKGHQIANHMVTCIEEDRTCIAALGKLANHHWYTYYHSARVASYALALAMEMGITNKAQLEEIAVGCLFHDIGKSKISLEILNKTARLDVSEWMMIRKHPEYGHELLRDSRLGKVPLEIVLHHHERLDGKGYPHNLGVSDIMKEVRIASFADTFDAMTTNRPYQPSRTRFEALDLIRHQFLEQFDKDCYKAMVLILQRSGQHS